MKIIKSSVEIVPATDPLKHIEKAYRLCYKSEDRITDTSAKEFVPRMIGIGHLSPVEHFRFIVQVPDHMASVLTCFKNPTGKHIERTRSDKGSVISCSARPLIEAIIDPKGDDVVRQCAIEVAACIADRYGCFELFPGVVSDFAEDPHLLDNCLVLEQLELTPEELEVHGWFTAKFVCDRGVTHEIVRHRMASYSQESTRYCNYSKGKFGNGITVIEPCFWNQESAPYHRWKNACGDAEEWYFDLLRVGATAQEARSVLPNSLKTELLMTTTHRYWEHFFQLRCDPAAHPQMREVAIPLSELAEELMGGEKNA